MCGRFSMALETDDVRTALALGQVPESWKPRYNVAPTQAVAAVSDVNTRDVVMLRWGLVPFWAKDPSIGSRMINARSETLTEKTSFKKLLSRRRCLILADGFFEWQKASLTTKGSIPFYFSLIDGEPFGFAGLWDQWADKANPGESALTTCTIITCAANALVADVHERMPVILSGDRMWQWLQAESEVEALSLLRPVDPTLMRAWQVSRRVNDVSNDDPAILEAV